MFGVRLIPEKEPTLTALDQLSAQTEEASELLAKGLHSNGNGSQDYLLQIRPISEECNEIVRQVSERLKHTFMAALDREDIYGLVMSLTGVVQRLDRFAACFRRYRPGHSTPEMIRMVDLIQKIVRELGHAVSAVERQREIRRTLEAVTKIQREGNEICREALSRLLRSRQSPTEVLIYKDLYEQLKSVIERCGQVGSLLERISIKNA